jgi:hypothetical protein
MKRRGKCAGKIPYAYRQFAEAQVIKNFLYKRKTLGIYECPTCLDFHLTHLYDNRSPQLKQKCNRLRTKYFRLLPEKRHSFIERVMIIHINGEPSKTSNKKVKKSKIQKPLIKPVLPMEVPIIEVQLSPAKPLWRRILDIFKFI